MSEKLKPNFTPIPNVILDEMMRMLAPGATKVLFAICRFTFGWGKQWDRISLAQLQEITGMARGSVARSIKELGDIVTVTPGDPRRQQASKYRLNIEISDKELVSLRDQLLVSKGDQASLLASLIKRPSKDNQRNKKKTPPQSSSSDSSESFKIGEQEYRWPSPEGLVALYNDRTPAECPAVRMIDKSRREKAKKYLILFPEKSFWERCFDNVGASKFLRGLVNRNGHESFTCDLDWLLSKGKDASENCVKVYDGKYNERG